MQATTVPSLDFTTPPVAAQQDVLGEYKAIELLLDLAMTQVNAQGAYLYRFDRERSDASLAVWTGLPPTKGSGLVLANKNRLPNWHLQRTSPLVLHDSAAADWRFKGLAEFKRNRFESLVSVPLLENNQPIGVVNLCRLHPASMQPRELAFLMSLSLPLAALLSGAAVREQLEKTTQQLADRKWIDRAKGLLQARFAWTEEQAYLHIRRSSRQRRIPMSQVARELIDSAQEAEGGVLESAN